MKDLTKGSIKKNLRGLTLSFVLTSVISMGTGLIDSFWLGRLVGKDAFAAMSIAQTVWQIFMIVLIGLITGGSILIAQYFGAKEYKKISDVVTNMSVITVVLSIILIGTVQIFDKDILYLIQAPYPIWPQTLLLLRLYSYIIFVFYINFLIIILFRTAGDAKTPIRFTIIGLIGNFCLDPIFIHWWGISGAILATFASVCVATVYGIIIFKKKSQFEVKIRFQDLSLTISKKLFIVGFPNILDTLFFSFGMAATQIVVNHFGVDVVAAYGIGSRIDSILLLLGNNVGGAMGVIVGQNRGAKKDKRVLVALHHGMRLGVILTLIASVLGFIFAPYLCMIFVTSKVVIAIGTQYIRIISIFYLFLTVFMVFMSFLNAVGDTKASMVISAIATWGGRLPCAIIFSIFLGYSGIVLGIGVSWIFAMVLGLWYIKSRRWEKVRII